MRPLPVALPTPFAVGKVNAYLFLDDPVTLVDPGPDYAPAREALENALTAHGLELRAVRQIIVTHYHPDHGGLAPRIAEETNATLRMHPETARRLADPYAGDQQLEEIVRRHGVPGGVRRAMRRELDRIVGYLAPLANYEPLLDGDIVQAGGFELSCLLTPGHASGHLALVHSDYVVGGDLLIHGITPNPVLEVDVSGERVPSLPQYLSSVERIAQLGRRLILPGHRREIPDPEVVIGRFREEVRMRQTALLEALREGGPTSAFALSQRFFPMERGADPFLALGEVLGHLDLLVAAGKAQWREETDGKLLAAG